MGPTELDLSRRLAAIDQGADWQGAARELHAALLDIGRAIDDLNERLDRLEQRTEGDAPK